MAIRVAPRVALTAGNAESPCHCLGAAPLGLVGASFYLHWYRGLTEYLQKLQHLCRWCLVWSSEYHGHSRILRELGQNRVDHLMGGNAYSCPNPIHGIDHMVSTANVRGFGAQTWSNSCRKKSQTGLFPAFHSERIREPEDCCLTSHSTETVYTAHESVSVRTFLTLGIDKILVAQFENPYVEPGQFEWPGPASRLLYDTATELSHIRQTMQPLRWDTSNNSKSGYWNPCREIGTQVKVRIMTCCSSLPILVAQEPGGISLHGDRPEMVNLHWSASQTGRHGASPHFCVGTVPPDWEPW